MTSEMLVTAGCSKKHSQKSIFPCHAHCAEVEHLTLALVSLLPEHAPDQNKTGAGFNIRKPVVLQIIYRTEAKMQEDSK